MTAKRPIVGVRIIGGLGNQMFLYAAALAMAERLDSDLICDVSHYRRRRTRDRQLNLPAFGIRYVTGRAPPYNRLRGLAIRMNLVADRFRNAEQLHAEGYDPRFHQIAGSCALAGYLQSWRYFVGHEDPVRRAFDVTRFASQRTRLLADEISRCEHAVAIHVRRGDYANAQEVHPLMRRDYYDAARDALSANGRRPTFFLFSDDLQAASGELAGWGDLRLVSGLTPLEDMYLMTRCRHFIIANSTFSWWAAWLGMAADKCVVAPATWFGPAYKFDYDLDDRIVPGWLAI